MYDSNVAKYVSGAKSPFHSFRQDRYFSPQMYNLPLANLYKPLTLHR